MAPFQLFFSVQRIDGSPTGPDPENRASDWDIGSPGSPFPSGLQVPVRRGIVVQEQDPLGDLPPAFFFQNILQLHQKKWVIIHLNSLALWKIINEEDAVLIPKIEAGENFPSGILHSDFFGGGVSRYAATPLIVALPPGHSDITRFRPWSPIAPDRKSFR